MRITQLLLLLTTLLSFITPSHALSIDTDGVHVRFGVHFRDYDGYVDRHNWHEHFHWQRSYGRTPARAFIAGYEPHRELYICQTYYNGGVHPGKVVAGNCNITYAGHEIERHNFRVLTRGRGLHWRRNRGFIPPNAVPGGYEKGHPLYICRTHFRNGVYPGKIVDGRCNIGYGGREYVQPNFRILAWR